MKGGTLTSLCRKLFYFPMVTDFGGLPFTSNLKPLEQKGMWLVGKFIVVQGTLESG